MEDFFWSIFRKSGNIEAFLAYKDYKQKSDFDKKTNKNNIKDAKDMI